MKMYTESSPFKIQQAKELEGKEVSVVVREMGLQAIHNGILKVLTPTVVQVGNEQILIEYIRQIRS